MTAPETTSTRPYLLRALFEWCTDNGLTPHIAVRVDRSTQVPMEFVRDGQIVLNISYDATSGLLIGNEYVEFKARFGGKPRDILVPVRRVIAIYARENGQGMAFPLEDDDGADVGKEPAMPESVDTAGGNERGPVQLQSVDGSVGQSPDKTPPPPPRPPSGGGRPSLKRVK